MIGYDYQGWRIEIEEEAYLLLMNWKLFHIPCKSIAITDYNFTYICQKCNIKMPRSVLKQINGVYCILKRDK